MEQLEEAMEDGIGFEGLNQNGEGETEEIMSSDGIELSEAEVQEAAASVQSLLTSATCDHHGTHHDEIRPESQLPAQILSTEVTEDTDMIIDDEVSTITFQRISEEDVVEEPSEETVVVTQVDGTTEVVNNHHHHHHHHDKNNEKLILLEFGPLTSVIEDKQQEVAKDECVGNDVLVLNNEGSKSSSVSNDIGLTATNIQLPFSFPGQSFNEQAQKLILNVWDFFKRAKKDPTLVSNLRGPQDHAAAALNVGTKTIGKIAKRVIRLGKLETPGKKRNRPKTVLDSVGADGEEVLRSIIREMYDKRIAPTIPLVLAEAKTRINFKGSTTSLRRILKRMGFKYGGIDNSLIQSEKTNVSGWKEKSSKKGKPWKTNQPKRKSINNNNNNRKSSKHAEDVVESVTTIAPVPQVVEADGIIQAHETCPQELIQSHEVIIHYQKPDEAFMGQAGQNEILMTADPSQIIQLQLEPNGETVPVTVVQEWQWQSGVNETTAILGLKSL